MQAKKQAKICDTIRQTFIDMFQSEWEGKSPLFPNPAYPVTEPESRN